MYSRFTITAQDLALIRGDRLLFKHCNFTVSSGQVLYIKGANGAGKTSLLNTLTGFIEPDNGAFSVSPENHFHTWLTRNTLYLGHHTGIKSALTVTENLAFYAHLRGVTKPDFTSAIAAVGLAGFDEQLAAHLSQGQKRRIALARLLIEPVALWILDEPLVALDVDGQAWLCGLIEQQVNNGGAVIVTSHQPLTLNCTVSELELAGVGNV
ncbi:MAG: cytochrome c biogenesis heme-transporting ATPase CcmA [Gammaproteobacteria bacterium]|nr:cytochrome c biogenesis heme-transporting ATPase CcmA [Gammaproteobacteria bacterium]